MGKNYKFDIEKETAKFCASLPPPFPKPCAKIAKEIVRKYKYYSVHEQRNLFYVFKDFIDAVLLRRMKIEDEETVKYIVEKDGKYAQTTKILRYELLKSIYNQLGYDMPIPVKAFKKEDIVKRKDIFTPEAVEVIVKNILPIDEEITIGRAYFPPEYVKGFIALIFIYGLRRYEFYKIRKEDFILDDNTFLVRSAKGSVVRHHLVYDEVRGILIDFIRNIHHPDDMRYLNILFRVILSYAGIRKKKRRNIHGVRKTLTSLLLQNGANPVFVNDFLRWKGKGTMLEFYANMDPIYVDKEIYKVHPFISFFR